MKKYLAQYLNEIVSITIMLLMTVALIAGQASPVSMGADDQPDRLHQQAVRIPGEQ